MPIVKMPDGTQVRFPDDMPREQIKGMIASKFPEVVPQQAQEPKQTYDRGAVSAGADGIFSGLMMGFDDEIGAGMMAPIQAAKDMYQGKGFDLGRAYDTMHERLDSEKAARREAHPIASTAGEIAGGLTTASGAAKKGITTLGRFGNSVKGRVASGVVEGAGYGALAGAGEAKEGERLSGAAQGGAIGALTGGALEGAGGMLAQKAATKAATPATQSLKQEADAIYNAARSSGVAIQPKAFNHLHANLKMAAGQKNKILRPKTTGVLKEIKALEGKPVDLENFMELRQTINKELRTAQGADEVSLTRMKKMVDSFADNIKPEQVSGGVEHFAKIKDANQIYTKFKKAEIIDDLMRQAKDWRTGLDQGIRVKFGQLAQNKRKMSNFNKQEQAAIRKIAKGGSPENVLRAIGWFSPNGPVGAFLNTGVGLSGGLPMMAATGGAGYLARKGAGAMQRGNVAGLDRLIKTGQARVPMPKQLPTKRGPLIAGSTLLGNELYRRVTN